MKELSKALEQVQVTYEQLVSVANDIISKCTNNSDAIIKEINKNIENLTNDDFRNYMLKLSLISYSFSDIKEKSSLKAECAETIRKETYARNFNTQDGSVAVRENQATINTSEEILVELIFEMVASSLKTKLDEIHRVVDTLKMVLTTRLSEAKLTQTISVGENNEKSFLYE